MTAIGANIAKLRNEHKLSQLALAEMLCVTPQCVSRWEQGKTEPDLDTITKLSKVFNCSIEDLVEEGRMEANNKYKNFRHITHTVYLITSLVMIAFAIYMIFDYVYALSPYTYIVFLCASLAYLITIFVLEVITNYKKKKYDVK